MLKRSSVGHLHRSKSVSRRGQLGSQTPVNIPFPFSTVLVEENSCIRRSEQNPPGSHATKVYIRAFSWRSRIKEMHFVVPLSDDSPVINPDRGVLYPFTRRGFMNTNIDMQSRLLRFSLEAPHKLTLPQGLRQSNSLFGGTGNEVRRL